MQHGIVALVAGLSITFVGYSRGLADEVEVKGPHICCPQCVSVAKKILSKVEGVSEVKPDAKTKTVTFTATDESAAKAGFKALLDGGFFGTATRDGKAIRAELPAPKKGEKSDDVTVKDVHVCCGACRKAINALFKDAKVSYEGKGPQMTVRIQAADLDCCEVIDALHKAGFHGNLAK